MDRVCIARPRPGNEGSLSCSAQIAPHVPAFSVVLLVVCGILIGVALTAWRSGDDAELEQKVRSLREENVDLQALLRQQQEISRQHEEHQRTASEQSAPLRELTARLELFLRHRQSEHGSIEDGLRTLQQLVHATHQDLRAEREQRGAVTRQLETAQAELLTSQRSLAAVIAERDRLSVAEGEWRSDRQSLEARIDDLRQETDEKQTRWEQERRQRLALDELLKEKESVLQETHRSAEAAPAWEAEVQRMQAELAASHEKRERVAEERDAAIAALEEAGHAYIELQRDVDSHRRTIDTIERQRSQTELKLQGMQQQAIDLREQERGQQELISRYDASRQELAEMRRHEAVLRAQLAEALDSQRRWQLELQTATAAAAADRQRLEQLEQQLSSTEQQSERIRSERESILDSLRGAQAQNRSVTEQLGDQERLIQELQDEVGMLRSLLERRAAAAPATRSNATVPDEIDSASEAQVSELERQVEELREQLRMAQVQAHELIQRQPTGGEPAPADATVRQLQQQVHQQSRAITQLERDRQDLLARIQRQNQLLEDRAA